MYDLKFQDPGKKFTRCKLVTDRVVILYGSISLYNNSFSPTKA